MEPLSLTTEDIKVFSDHQYSLRPKGRKLKRIQNWLHKHCGYGKYVIDCRYHPCIVTLLERDYHDIEGTSLINGSGTACSLMHCGIEPISKKLAEEMAAYAKTHTWNEYLIKYHQYTAEDIAEYERLDAIWDFEKN
jgi:hypothetical protein